MGLFSRKQTPESAPRAAEPDVQETQQASAPQPSGREQLPAQGPLRSLVDGLLVDGAQRAKLTLVQRGSTMSYQTERAVADGAPETDSGVVDQASPLFDDVAALYTESMNSSTGAWQTVVISAGAEDAGSRPVTVDYDYPSAEHRTEEYEIGRRGTSSAERTAQAPAGDERASSADRPRDARQADSGSGVGTAAGTAAGAGAGAATVSGGSGSRDQEDRVRVVDAGTEGADRRESGQAQTASSQTASSQAAPARADQPSDDADAARRDDRQDDRARSEADRTESNRPEEGGDRSSAAAAGAGAGAGTAALAGSGIDDRAARSDQDERVPEGQLTEDGTVDNLAPRQQGQEPIEVDHEVQESVARTAGHQSTAGSGTGEQVAGEQGSAAQGSAQRTTGEQGSAQQPRVGEDQVPSHVDHDEWRDDRGAQRTAAAPTGAAAARSASTPDEAGAPTMASGADVAPSYRAAEQAGGGEDLAQGNKVLSQKDIARRVAGAQKRLFGADGSARDVSTVLIRVRTLGTYYDALTHVRQGGFWDQRSTFDLIPEEDLQVQALKQDSYVEGEGAPLAIMFRFRPGIPPEVSFDYDDEEAFVRYENRLPSQNYVEELRMYPRTGANIPQHVNDALQDWNY